MSGHPTYTITEDALVRLAALAAQMINDCAAMPTGDGLPERVLAEFRRELGIPAPKTPEPYRPKQPKPTTLI